MSVQEAALFCGCHFSVTVAEPRFHIQFQQCPVHASAHEMVGLLADIGLDRHALNPETSRRLTELLSRVNP